MADVTLSNGREVIFDLYAFTMAEFRALLNVAQSEDEGDEIVARAAGMTLQEVQNLPYLDYRKLFAAFIQRVRNPLENPH